jgi:hypothetical protein
LTTDDAVSLRAYLESRLDNHDKLHEQHEVAHNREHTSTDLAISKAEQATSTALTRAQEVVDERFKVSNAWREQFSELTRAFITKTEYEPRHAVLIERMESMDSTHQRRLGVLEDANIIRSTREQERERAMTRTMALVGLAAAVGGFMLSLVTRLLGIG